MPEAAHKDALPIAVIGAGPAGLAAAHQLVRKGLRVEVFEADSAVGGMARTIPLWGQRVDLGPHRFLAGDPRVNEFWLAALAGRHSRVQRHTRIHYQRRFFDYPLKPANALLGLGPMEAARCVLSYFNARLFPLRDQSSFEAWVTNRFGRRLYAIFFRHYSEKLWGIPCRELDAAFAAQRIRKLSLFEALKDALLKSGAARHKTLADEFAYPHGGSGAVYEALANSISAGGGAVHLNTPVQAVRPAQNGRPALLRLADGGERPFAHIVSTMPLTRLIDGLDAPVDIRVHAGRLTYRNTILVYLRVGRDGLFPDQWIYVHSPELQTGRMTNFANWCPSIRNGSRESILCLEYWCGDGEALWSLPDEALVELARAEAAQTSLVQAADILEGRVIRIPRSYPVYTAGYRRHLEPLERYLSQLDSLTAIGRSGAFKYNNQDHSILMGLLAAENIAEGAGHDLWSVNTDDEYQEARPVAATATAKGKCR